MAPCPLSLAGLQSLTRLFVTWNLACDKSSRAAWVGWETYSLWFPGKMHSEFQVASKRLESCTLFLTDGGSLDGLVSPRSNGVSPHLAVDVQSHGLLPKEAESM